MTAVSSGVASMRTGKRCPLASSRPSPLGHESSQRCRSSGRSKASPTVLMAAASCCRSSLKAAFWRSALPECPVMVREESSERRSWTSWVMNWSPSRCFLARFAIDTMKAAPSGCCMIDHTSSTTRRRGLGSWAAAAHTVSVQTIAAAGLSSGSRRCRSNTVIRASFPRQVVSLVGEQVSEAAGGKGPAAALQESASPASLFSQICVEITEAGALAGLCVVARQGVVEGGAALRAETLAHHHLDEASQAADALEHLLGVALAR